MNNVIAILSMLHEAPEQNSASRLFRRDPVLCWTMDRLSQCARLNGFTILCWEDQAELVKPIAAEAEALMLVKGPRQIIPQIQSIAAARKFADGWRGGLLGTCDFDNGYFGPWVVEILKETNADAAVLVDPASGLVDPQLIDRVITHAIEKPEQEIVFAPAAPGLSGPLLRRALIERLATAQIHPGRLMHYLPEQPMREPLSGEGCVPVSPGICRTTRRFKLDSQAQIARITDAAVSLNGTLIKSSAEELLYRLDSHDAIDRLPRDVTVEITADRATQPIFLPRIATDQRREMTLEIARCIFEQLAVRDDIRVTFGGIGDPLLHPFFFEIVEAARSAGINAIHVETDLLADQSVVSQLAGRIDVLSILMPAISAGMYQQMMGVDGLAAVIDNVRALVSARTQHGRGVPVLAPTFIKCAQNMAEMETWYDQWLSAVGSAVILGPSDFAGQISFTGVADMSPPKRRACSRIQQRLTILADGSVVSCEQDFAGKFVMGNALSDRLSDVWTGRFGQLRADHACAALDRHPLCAQCREWHRA